MTEEWDKDIPDFERFPKITKEMKKIGESRTIQFKSDPRLVDSDVMESAYVKKNIKNITPKNCFVVVLEDKGEKKEFWFNETSFSVRRELKAIKDDNDDTLVNAWAKITRIAVANPTAPNWKLEKAEPSEEQA